MLAIDTVTVFVDEVSCAETFKRAIWSLHPALFLVALASILVNVLWEVHVTLVFALIAGLCIIARLTVACAWEALLG